MGKIKLCKRCVNPSTRPNVVFDKQGICNVCQVMLNNKDGAIDWDKRRDELKSITAWGQEASQSSYDCIVTVSGGKDSMKQAFYARDELGLNPLLVSAVYPPEQLHERGAQNLENLIRFRKQCRLKLITVSLNPQVYKQLMALCFKRYSNIFNASEMALYAIPIHVAIAQQIPLIFLGENPAHTIGEVHGKLDGDASQMRNANTLKGGGAKIFQSDDISAQDLHWYNYPSEQDVEQANLRLVYLGYYIEEWSGWNNAKFAINKGLQTRTDSPENIGDLWGVSALDEEFRIVNQQIKYVKLGFGHVTDQVMERIHAGKISREDGIKLIQQYDGKCHSKYVKKLCEYLNISVTEFQMQVEKSRNLDIWKKDSAGNWLLDVDYSA